MANIPTQADCPFCKIAKGELRAVRVYEDAEVLAIMDLYPATTGHVLVFPRKHIQNIYAMSYGLGAGLFRVAIKISRAVKDQLSPDGLNIIQSNDLAAGQTIPHFHLHIVPRYKNDAVALKFGHGNRPAGTDELEPLAGRIRSALK